MSNKIIRMISLVCIIQVLSENYIHVQSSDSLIKQHLKQKRELHNDNNEHKIKEKLSFAIKNKGSQKIVNDKFDNNKSKEQLIIKNNKNKFEENKDWGDFINDVYEDFNLSYNDLHSHRNEHFYFLIKSFLLVFFSELSLIHYYSILFLKSGLCSKINFFISIISQITLLIFFISISKIIEYSFSILLIGVINKNSLDQFFKILGSCILLVISGYYMHKGLISQFQFEGEIVSADNEFQESTNENINNKGSNFQAYLKKFSYASETFNKQLAQHILSIPMLGIFFLNLTTPKHKFISFIGGSFALIFSIIILFIVSKLLRRSVHFPYLFLISCFLFFAFSSEILLKLDIK